MSKFNKAPLAGLVAMVLASSAAFAKGPPVKPPAVTGSLSIDSAMMTAGCAVSGSGFAADSEVLAQCDSAKISQRYVCVARYQAVTKVKGQLTTVDVVEYSADFQTVISSDLAADGVATANRRGNFGWSSGVLNGPTQDDVSAALVALNCDSLDRGETKEKGVTLPAADFSAELCEFSVSDAAVTASGLDANSVAVAPTAMAVGASVNYCGGN
ncbi:MAG: hypothetical protein ACO3LM_06915 [Steroidobacteraceae bacterium]